MVSGASQNGWSRNGSVRKYRVPGTKVDLWLNPTAAPLLLYAARRFYAEVAGPDYSPTQAWGFARSGPIGNSGIYSNHESGSAIDLNATHYPWGSDRMGSNDESKCRSIVRALGGAVRWGGDYHSKLDQMHWEINCSRAEAQAQIKRMRLNPDGTVKGSSSIAVPSVTDEEDQMFVLRTNSGQGAHYLCVNKRAYLLPKGYDPGTGTNAITVPGTGMTMIKALGFKVVK